MPPRPRSRKARVAELRGQLQAQGQNMADIAGCIARDERVTPRAAWRMAHGLSQQQVADCYNTWFPPGSDTALITAKQVSYWDTWPQSGREPSLTNLTRLARIYSCTISDLITDHENPGGTGTADTTGRHPDAADGTAGRLLPQVSEINDWGHSFDHAGDIRSLADWVTNSNTTDDAIDQIDRAAAYLAEVHIQMPPRAVLSGVLQLHHTVRECLQGGRQRLHQTRELLRTDSGLAAHACLLLGDLGQDRQAARYGETSLVLAREAGASEARSWAVLAKTARWQGKYVQSAELARRGFEASGPSPVKAELAFREANAIALFGDASRARQALQRAGDMTETLPSGCGPPGSVWSFPAGRQAVFALSVAIHTGDPDGALRAADTARAGWGRGEPKGTANWAQIQAGISIACLLKGSLDAAAHHIAPVLDLPEELRISTVTGYLRKLDGLLAQPRFAASDTTTRLREGIRNFISLSPPGTVVTEST